MTLVVCQSSEIVHDGVVVETLCNLTGDDSSRNTMPCTCTLISNSDLGQNDVKDCIVKTDLDKEMYTYVPTCQVCAYS